MGVFDSPSKKLTQNKRAVVSIFFSTSLNFTFGKLMSGYPNSYIKV
jgi:hypothetical protein